MKPWQKLALVGVGLGGMTTGTMAARSIMRRKDEPKNATIAANLDLDRADANLAPPGNLLLKASRAVVKEQASQLPLAGEERFRSDRRNDSTAIDVMVPRGIWDVELSYYLQTDPGGVSWPNGFDLGGTTRTGFLTGQSEPAEAHAKYTARVQQGELGSIPEILKQPRLGSSELETDSAVPSGSPGFAVDERLLDPKLVPVTGGIRIASRVGNVAVFVPADGKGGPYFPDEAQWSSYTGRIGSGGSGGVWVHHPPMWRGTVIWRLKQA